MEFLSQLAQQHKRLTIDIREAIRLTGLGRTTLYALIKNGSIQTSRVGKRRLILLESLERFIEANISPRNE